ncbi:MAG: hypothetical protein ACO3JL_02905, partial [Myxococcota bacterium]
DCVREAQCGLINQQTGESLCEYICEVPVACDQNSKVCGAEYTIDDATLCRDLTLCPPPQSCAR